MERKTDIKLLDILFPIGGVFNYVGRNWDIPQEKSFEIRNYAKNGLLLALWHTPFMVGLLEYIK